MTNDTAAEGFMSPRAKPARILECVRLTRRACRRLLEMVIARCVSANLVDAELTRLARSELSGQTLPRLSEQLPEPLAP